MKFFSLLVCISLLASASSAQDIPAWKITDLEKNTGKPGEEVLVINFWATFCKPCVAEIPHFIRITNNYRDRGVKLLLVSLDMKSQYPGKIRSFVKKHRFTAPVFWLDETNADYFCPKVDTSWSGSIPATLIVNKRTGYRKFYEEEMSGPDLEKALQEAIGH